MIHTQIDHWEKDDASRNNGDKLFLKVLPHSVESIKMVCVQIDGP